MPAPEEEFRAQGFVRLPASAESLAWASHAFGAGRAILADPGNAAWFRHGATWFVGVNLLPNDAAGRLPGGPPLDGPATALLDALGRGGAALDPGQVSAVFPGYPRPSPEDSDSAFRYRRDRDAAHVDGLLPVGPERRRMAREAHAYILGIALSDADPDASPLVAWAGSHRIVAAAFRAATEGRPEEEWPDVDLTTAYHEARARAFATCRRVPLPIRPGEAVVLHPLALHGIAPWRAGAAASPEGRITAYFRPQPASLLQSWGD